MTQAQFDFEQTWAGRVPARWRWTRNKELLVESQAVTVDGSEELLSVSHLTGITPRSEKNVTMTAAENLDGYRLVDSGDLVINTMWAWMGALGVATQPGIVSPAYGVYSPRPDAPFNPVFYDYLYRSTTYVMEMTRLSRGIWSSRLRLYPDVFLRMAVPVPPPEEQRAIADYLDRETTRIDMLIEEQQVLVGLLAERRVVVMAEPFGQAHPTVPLGSALEELIDHRGKTPGKVGDKSDDFTDEGVPVVSAIHIKNRQISWGERERFVPYWMFEKWMPVRLRTGDVLLTSEAPLGNVAQVPNDAPLVLSQRLFALRGREDVLDSTYLRFFLESDRGQALLGDGASGSTVSGIRQSRLVQIPVPVPPLDEQRQVSQQIREQIAKIDTLIAETERFIELSKERRSALITAAVTGRIDVREMA